MKTIVLDKRHIRKLVMDEDRIKYTYVTNPDYDSSNIRLTVEVMIGTEYPVLKEYA